MLIKLNSSLKNGIQNTLRTFGVIQVISSVEAFVYISPSKFVSSNAKKNSFCECKTSKRKKKSYFLRNYGQKAFFAQKKHNNKIPKLMLFNKLRKST